jgi:hypothetical protein
MMDVKTPFGGGLTDGGINFEQAVEIHRLHQVDCLTATQIVRVTGISLAMVSGVLVGRHFPGSEKQLTRRSNA